MKLVAIRIRGITGVKHDIAIALSLLRLDRKFHCVVLEDTPTVRGQLQKCKDYITYGVIDAATEKLLIEKRGKKDAEGKLKPFALHPPRGGFERKGIKAPFTLGGVLGNRKEKIIDLLQRML